MSKIPQSTLHPQEATGAAIEATICFVLVVAVFTFHRPAYLVQGRAASRMGETKRRAQQQVILQGEVGARAWRLYGQTREEVGALSRLSCFGASSSAYLGLLLK